jgi:hypothetical protein
MADAVPGIAAHTHPVSLVSPETVNPRIVLVQVEGHMVAPGAAHHHHAAKLPVTPMDAKLCLAPKFNPDT